uniref:Secreted protein n=1 Tax=Steinernema glaseri TaxID=37863 RepID=A0A1I7Z2L0_9BILA
MSIPNEKRHAAMKLLFVVLALKIASASALDLISWRRYLANVFFLPPTRTAKKTNRSQPESRKTAPDNRVVKETMRIKGI